MSPTALSRVLIDVEEMLLFVARPVVLATSRDTAPHPTLPATPLPTPRYVCAWAEQPEVANLVSIGTSFLSSLLTPPHCLHSLFRARPASRKPQVTWRQATTRRLRVIGSVWAGR